MKSLLALILIVFLAYACGFLWYLQTIRSWPDTSAQPCEALVVLTGSAGRIEYGFKLLEEGRAPRLFITGVGDDRHSEAFLARYHPSEALKAALAKPGVLTIDREANNTVENAVQTEAWLADKDYQSLCLITAHYHLPRSLTIFERAMPDQQWVPIASPTSDVQLHEVWERFVIFNVLLREYSKWLYVLAAHQVG